MSHRLTDIDCTQFRSVLIVGRNRNNPRESNAVGKTTIFRAIEYVLFGTATINLERIVRHGCDRCKVTFEFEVGDQKYQIVRSRVKKSGKSELKMFQWAGSSWVSVTQKTSSETETELNKIVKISPIAFRSSILFAQLDLHGLASVTASTRKTMLKEPLQISIYNKYEKIAKEKTSAALKLVEKVKIQIEGLGDPTADLLKLSTSLEDAKTNLRDAEKISETYRIQIEKYQQNLIELEKAKSSDTETLTQRLYYVQADIDKVDSKIYEVAQAIERNQSQLNSVNKEIQKTKSSIEKLETVHSQLSSQSTRELTIIKDDIVKITNKEVEGRAYIAKLQMDRTRLQHVIPDGDACDRCLQPVSKEHRDNCESKRQIELQDTISNLTTYSNLLETVKNKRLLLEGELKNTEERSAKLASLDVLLATDRASINQNGKLIKQLEETLTSRSIELGSLQQSIVELNSQKTILKTQIDSKNQNSLLAEIKKTTLNIGESENKLKDVLASIASCNVATGMLQEKIKSRLEDQVKITAHSKELEVFEKEYSMRLKVQQAFGSSGIPTMIINTILDDLQIVANDLLTKVRPGIEIVFLVAKTRVDGQQEDTLDIVYRINGIEHEYEQLSGAQKVSITLCLKLGLSLIIQHRIGVDIKFLILDEVDSQFDDVSLDSFSEVIKKWQDKFTIFVVTHNKYLKDKFTHAILVEGDEVNGSVGTLVNSW